MSHQYSVISITDCADSLFTFTHPSPPLTIIYSRNICPVVTESPLPVIYKKKNNGNDNMNKQSKRQKLKEYRKQLRNIEHQLDDHISKAEAKLMLYVLLYSFDGFARQQQLINRHMLSKYHWGNKRTARVLKTLAEIEVLDRSRSKSDNWTLFFLVKGFIEKCRKRIIRAGANIKERMSRCRFAILSITRMYKERTGT